MSSESTPSGDDVVARQRWGRVVEACGGKPNGSCVVKVSCPLHKGGGRSLQVEQGKNGYPMLHCFGECADAWQADTKGWLKRVRKALVSLGVKPSDLSPSGKSPAKPSSPTRQGGKPLPTEALVSKWHRVLMESEARRQDRRLLKKQRGLKKKTVRQAGIGKHYKRFTIPVRDGSGALINVRKYDPHADGKDKMIGVAGHNSAVAYPLDVLQNSGDKPILWTEGELDALLANQVSEGQYVAATGTGGAGTPPKDLSIARGRTVYLAFDCDEAGVKGSRTLALRLLAAGAKTVHRVDLGLDDGEDVTDWFVRHRKSAGELWALCEQTPAFDPQDDDDAEREDVLWLDAVEPKPLRWLWRGRIPFGKLTMLEGDPGLGKSTLWMDWVARVSTGAPFPGDVGTRASGKALIIAGEDDLEDTITPRLKAADADLRHVASIALRRDGEGNVVPLSIPDDLHRIERMIRQHGITLLVIDPIMAFLGEDINSHNDASTRKALSPLVEVLQKTGAAAVLVRHLNKSGEMQALYRGGGSIAFIGAARSGLVVGRHPEEEDVRVLAQTKANLSRDAKTLTYTIGKLTEDEDLQDTYIEWGQELDVSADDLFSKKDGRRNSPERDEAVRILQDLLVDGPMSATEVKEAVSGSGISWRTYERAKDAAGVETYQQRDGKGVIQGWLWSTGPEVTFERESQ